MNRSSILIAAVLLAGVFAGAIRAQSPYELDRWKDGWIAGGSAAGGLAAALLEQTPAPLTEREIALLSRESVNRFDRSATYNYSPDAGAASDVLVGAMVAAPLALLIDGRIRGDWRVISMMYAETMAIAVILPAYGKGAVDRIRPFVYNPDAPLDEKTTSDARKAFFSRHTAVAFASAAYISTVYGDYHPGSAAGPYLWAGSMLAAAAVGIMRCESGEHFPSDVITGAAAGFAAGYLVPRLHRSPADRVSLLPDCSGSRAGVALSMRI
ncbi:MAG: phosphatase PAP2 family protein [Candidatus Krumholzibacteria bacterium]|nr:phosphatase PAP2 family protein [Candidatus Krumholzibacteria bacterium]